MSMFSITASAAKHVSLAFGLLVAVTANASIISTEVKTSAEIRAGQTVDATASNSGATTASSAVTSNLTGTSAHSTIGFDFLSSDAAVVKFDLGYKGSTNGYEGGGYMGGASFGNSSTINYLATSNVDLTVDWNFDYLGPNPFGLQIIQLSGGPFQTLGNYGIVGHHEGSTSYSLFAGNLYNISLNFHPNVSSGSGGFTGIEGTLSGAFDFKFGKTEVPESSGIALFAIGLLGLGLARRRKTA